MRTERSESCRKQATQTAHCDTSNVRRLSFRVHSSMATMMPSDRSSSQQLDGDCFYDLRFSGEACTIPEGDDDEDEDSDEDEVPLERLPLREPRPACPPLHDGQPGVLCVACSPARVSRGDAGGCAAAPPFRVPPCARGARLQVSSDVARQHARRVAMARGDGMWQWCAAMACADGATACRRFVATARGDGMSMWRPCGATVLCTVSAGVWLWWGVEPYIEGRTVVWTRSRACVYVCILIGWTFYEVVSMRGVAESLPWALVKLV